MAAPRRPPASRASTARPRAQPSAEVPGRRLWSRLTGRSVVLLLVLVALVTTLAMPVREYLQQRATINALREQVARDSVSVGALQRTRDQWRDPSYVETQARQRLHFVYPGEIGYVVLSPRDVQQARADGGGTPAPAPTTEQPWYATLWNSVQQADRGR